VWTVNLKYYYLITHNMKQKYKLWKERQPESLVDLFLLNIHKHFNPRANKLKTNTVDYNRVHQLILQLKLSIYLTGYAELKNW
jgi:hypothetical protein